MCPEYLVAFKDLGETSGGRDRRQHLLTADSGNKSAIDKKCQRDKKLKQDIF